MGKTTLLAPKIHFRAKYIKQCQAALKVCYGGKFKAFLTHPKKASQAKRVFSGSFAYIYVEKAHDFS